MKNNSSLAAHFAKWNTKNCGGGKRGRAKMKGVGGKEFLPALAFRRRRISCQRSWRAAY